MDTLMLIIGIVIVAVGVFMPLREFWCWYWKINKISSQMEEQNKLLRELVNRNEKPNMDVSPLSSIGKIQEETTKKCKRCLKRVDIDYSTCPHCGSSDFI